MAKRSRSSELWDEPDQPQAEDNETWEVGAGSRASSSTDDADWEEEDDSSGWFDDALDDLESDIPRGCDEGEVYRLLGRPGRRGRDD